MTTLRTALAAALVGLAAACAAAATVHAGAWRDGPERIVFELGAHGLVGFDERIRDQQWGGAVAVRVQRWGPLTLELQGFAVGGASGVARAGGSLPEAYTLYGAVPGVGVEVGRGPRRFGVGLFVRPPIIAVVPDHGDTVVRTPSLARSFFRVPNVTLTMGDDHDWIEVGGGGDPTPMEPRLGFVSYHWRSANDDATGGSAGLGVMGIVQGDGVVTASDLGLSFHLDGWIRVGDDVLMGLRGDVSSVVSLGVTFAYRIERHPASVP